MSGQQISVDPRNATGRKKAMLEKQNEEAIRARARELSLMNKQMLEEETAPVDYTAPRTAELAEDGGEVIEVDERPRKIYVNSPIEQMTYGRGVEGDLLHMDFSPGIEYTVTPAVAEHLEQLGYLRH